MRKFIIVILYSLFAIGFTCRENSVSSFIYEIVRIDSINSYYLIYASRNDSMHKIVSTKPLVKDKKCRAITINSRYELYLESLLNWEGELKPFSPKYNRKINCVAFDDSTNICLERDSIFDLYSSQNLVGLCHFGK